jgi:hypothetical protein
MVAKKDKNHNDAFMPAEPNEARLMKEVRHQLLTLPYCGVFDDLHLRRTEALFLLYWAP